MSGNPLWLNVRPTRGVAFIIHLALSVLIFSSLVAVMLIYWFPGDLFIMDGGWEGLKLVAMVDLVLGPALTLILFKPGKPGLKFDLSVIAAVQIAALGYGFYTTYDQRTVAVVFAENQFTTVSAKDNQESNKELARRELEPKALPPSKAFDIPLYISPLPDNYGKYLAEILNGLPSAQERSDRYVALNGHNEEMERHRKSVDDLEQSGALASVKKAASELGHTLESLEVYKFKARYASGYALYDPETSRIVDYVSYTKTDNSSNGASTLADNVE